MSDVLVLCYHAVSERWPADLSVTPGALESQLSLLVRRGYVGATFSQAVESPPAERTLAVTFDDAYLSVFDLARPILAEHRLPGTVFVPTGHAGRPEPMSWPGIDHWLEGEHRDELLPMSWEQLHRLGAEGWEIGSHTRSHPRLTHLDEPSLDAELTGSKEELERRLHRPCRSIAYPYGDVDGRVVAAARSAGYATGAGLPGPFRRPEPLLWPRVGVYHGDSEARFRRQVTRTMRRLQGSPRAWSALARAVRLARRAQGLAKRGR